MSELQFLRDGWLEGALDDADEQATFTRLKIQVGRAVLTRAFSERGGGETEAVNVPLLPLSSFLASQWWPLLYEPLRAGPTKRFPARHRLDLPMHGYVFPAIALCSAGEEAMLVDWAPLENEHSPLKFLTSPPVEPMQIARDSLEPALMDLVESTLARLTTGSRAHSDLASNWSRVRESLESPGQAAYCMSAGRLGLDPYDPDVPDLGMFADDLSEDLFNDLSDATDISNLQNASQWARGAQTVLDGYPILDIGAFGASPKDDLRVSAGEVGYQSAVTLRKRLALDVNRPAEAVAEFVGDGVSKAAVLSETGPASLIGLVHRTNGVAHIGTVARSARQRRFRACAAAYIAWCSDPGDVRAGTYAFTRRQQASRAFAAEMVAPSVPTVAVSPRKISRTRRAF
jgi:hypothetical protein